MSKLDERTSYGAKPTASESEYGAVGYRNRFGGFHHTTDTFAYVRMTLLLVKNLHHPQVARWLLKLLWRRWKHRSCDTVDFHHFGCTLDKFGRQMDDEYRWKRVWTGAP